ncbi:MAG: XRE family transcriptional regulator [Victivallales bacterium]|jgi:Zn-dependent peptidase ImmA (M78 family)/DNA-binding XRE family transcriptional regulator
MEIAVAKSIPANLKRIRNIKGLTQEDLAAKAGISRNAYRSIENGDSEPRVSNLKSLADALDIKIFDLLRTVPAIPSLRFRSNKTMNSREQDKRQQHIGDFACWLREFNFLENELKEKKRFELAKLVGSTQDPAEMAYKVRNTLKIDNEPICDICGLVESAGIKIFLIDSDLDNFFGFSLSEKDGGPAIGVNKSKRINVERKIFTVAHELGHILLHPDSFDSKEKMEIDDAEKEADTFASHLLMPQKCFNHELEKNKGLHWVKLVLHIKRIFKVSYKTVLIRLREEGLVDNSIWQKFALECKKLGFSLKDHYEPESLSQDDFHPEPVEPLSSYDFVESRLNLLVRKAFEKEAITMGKAAEILGIEMMAMRELSNAWRTVA